MSLEPIETEAIDTKFGGALTFVRKIWRKHSTRRREAPMSSSRSVREDDTEPVATDGGLLKARSRCGMLLLLAIGALVLAPAALAWSKTYVSNAWVAPAEYRWNGGYVSGINLNQVSWTTPDGHDAVGTLLCHPDSSCYVPLYNYSGFAQDFRSISYGSAWCGGASFNRWNQFFYGCYAQN